MANGIIGTSAELTGEATKATIMGGGHLARRLGKNVIQRLQPNEVPPKVLARFSPEVLAKQAILRQFEDRFAVVGNLIERESSEGELEARVLSAADEVVSGGLIDGYIALELRPVVPEDALRDPVLNDRRGLVVDILQDKLGRSHDVSVIPNAPIMPTEHADTSVDATTTWDAITDELDGLSHQLNSDPHDPAMLAITGSPYTPAIFSGQPAIDGHKAVPNGLWVLKHVGTLPEDNLFVRTH